MKMPFEERLLAGGWSALVAGPAVEVGIRIVVGHAAAGEGFWGIRVAVVATALLVGAGLARHLWSAARATSFWRGAFWGTLGSWLTAHVAILAFLIGAVLYEGEWARLDADRLEMIFDALVFPTVRGWWLIALAGVAAGCGFVAIFPRRRELILE